MIDKIRELIDYNLDKVFVGGLFALMFGFIAVLVFQPKEPFQVVGLLVGKEYTPASSSSGVGTGFDSSGKPVTVITTNSESEKWTAVLLVGDQIKTYEVSPSVFYALEDNSRVVLNCYQGKWIPLQSCNL